VGIDSISHPATPNDTAAEKRTSIAGNNNSDNLLGEIGVLGGQDGNPDNTDGDVTDEDGNGDRKITSEIEFFGTVDESNYNRPAKYIEQRNGNHS
jgi:hypothetical protein